MWPSTLILLCITSGIVLLATASPISNAQLVDSTLDLTARPFHWTRDAIKIFAPKPGTSKNDYISELHYRTNNAFRAVPW
jgi:hypothetical protein